MKLKLHHEKLKVVTNQQQAQLKDQQQKHINTIMYIQKQVRNVSAANNVIADMCVRAKDIICVQSVIKRILVNKMTQEGTHTFIKNEQSDLKYEQYVLIYIEHKNSNLPIKWLKSFSRILLIICEVEILTSLTLFRFNKINNIKQTSQLNQSSTAYLLKQLFKQSIRDEASLLQRQAEFQQIRLAEILTQISNFQELEQSEVRRLKVLNSNMKQTNQDKTQYMHRQLNALQHQLSAISKDEDVLQSEIKVMFNEEKEQEVLIVNNKKLQPLQTLADGIVGYDKMCVDIEAVQTQLDDVEKQYVEAKAKLKHLKQEQQLILQQNNAQLSEMKLELKSLRSTRTTQVQNLNTLQTQNDQTTQNTFNNLDKIEVEMKKQINEIQNAVYRIRTECSEKQGTLRNMIKLISVFEEEQIKRKGVM
ncbi:Conserved_hypothetical protein [Hexamita inflata]|uniref:Uncharacterized protein n=1 Tax=Hexamita inflata TaxID=28002 RepID=A0AA86UGX2_9EUKA|nr:Conserved hypothetical protein [Hexamita inflata]